MTSVSAVLKNNRDRSGLVSVDDRMYSLKWATITARAEGGVAATTLTQSYENPYAEALEVLYTLPLPANGAVTGYAIRNPGGVGGFRLPRAHGCGAYSSLPGLA
jgi:hypothetical protein